MAEGGKVKKGEPVPVGENGPEVFVPGVPGSVFPKWKRGMGDRQQEDAGYSLAHVVKPHAWIVGLLICPKARTSKTGARRHRKPKITNSGA
jgi:hypothetical protein